jgi:biopolymer transport protein ExbB
LSKENRVFGTLAGFRAAAGAAQRWLTWLGVLGAAGCAFAAACEVLPVWTILAAAALTPLGLLWGVLWRRRLEAAFWRGARVPERGKPVRLPLEALLVALFFVALRGTSALAADPSLVLKIGEGREIDVEALLRAAGIGGWIALGCGAVAVLVALYLLFSLWSANFAPRRLRGELLEKISAGDVEAARKLCASSGSLLARSVRDGLPPEGRQPTHLRELPSARIEASGRRGAARWRALVDLLAALGLLAPVAGLFGTALGLIEVFAAVAQQNSSTAWVAAGAVTALIPAAIALGVSLFSLAVYYLADLRLGALVAKCEASCMECAAALADLGADVRARSGLTTVELRRESERRE